MALEECLECEIMFQPKSPKHVYCPMCTRGRDSRKKQKRNSNWKAEVNKHLGYQWLEEDNQEN